MRLELPYPPSTNRLWRSDRGGRPHLTKEARRYKSAVRLRALAAGHRKPIEGPVYVMLAVYRPLRRGDLDNRVKAVLDALRGVAFVDDDQVVGLTAFRHDDPDNPRIVADVEAAW